MRLDDQSEPEPDFLLLKPSADDYTGRHPQPDDVFLLIEVSDTTLAYDREEKIPAYGRAGIAEVWIVNLNNASLEIYRDPHFTGYGSKTVLGAGDAVAPQMFPRCGGAGGGIGETVNGRNPKFSAPAER